MRSAVYIAAEGANGVRLRIEAIRARDGPWGGRIRFIGEAPNLANVKDIAALRLRMAAIKQEIEDRGHHLGVFVLDTLAAAAPGVDENTAKDMGPVLQLLQKLAVELSVCVIVVAHVGKDADKGLRGWSGIHASADGVIFVQAAANEEGTRTGQIVKVKDGETGENFAFGLEVVGLGFDGDGDPVTSCVVVERSVPAKSKRSQPNGPGAQAEEVLRAYDRLANAGAELPPHIDAPRGQKGVRLADLRSHVFDAGFHGETKPNGDEDRGARNKWSEARKKAFQRALLKLVEIHMLRKEEDFVWAV